MSTRLQELRDRKVGGQHLAVVRLAEQLLVCRDELTLPEAIEAARAGLRSACHLQQYFQARWFADQEGSLAEQSGQEELQAVATYHQGYVALYIGDVGLAVTYFQSFLARPGALLNRLALYVGPTWFSLGAAQLLQRQYEAAAYSYEQARKVYERERSIAQMAECDLQLAWVCLMAGGVDPAEAYLERAAGLLAEEPDPDLNFSYLCHRSLWCLRTGAIEEAVAHCEQVLAPAQLGVTSQHRGEAAWVLGECALVRGEVEQAKRFASVAMDEAIRSKWPGLMNLASDLGQRIAQSAHKPA